MDPEQAFSWVEFLQTAGGWGVAVILGFVVVSLWRYYEKRRDDAEKQLLEIVKTQTELLTANKINTEKQIELMAKLEKKD